MCNSNIYQDLLKSVIDFSLFVFLSIRAIGSIFKRDLSNSGLTIFLTPIPIAVLNSLSPNSILTPDLENLTDLKFRLWDSAQSVLQCPVSASNYFVLVIKGRTTHTPKRSFDNLFDSATASARQLMSDIRSIDALEMFHWLSWGPELVSFNFSHMYLMGKCRASARQ